MYQAVLSTSSKEELQAQGKEVDLPSLGPIISKARRDSQWSNFVARPKTVLFGGGSLMMSQATGLRLDDQQQQPSRKLLKFSKTLRSSSACQAMFHDVAKRSNIAR